MSATDDANFDVLIERLDKLTAVVMLAFDDKIAAASVNVREDAIKDAILEACASGWTGSPVVKAAAGAVGASGRTIDRRLSELVRLGAVQWRGAGPKSEYRSTGLL